MNKRKLLGYLLIAIPVITFLSYIGFTTGWEEILTAAKVFGIVMVIMVPIILGIYFILD